MHIDMRQIRELLKEDFVESMLQADQARIQVEQYDWGGWSSKYLP